MQVMFMHMPGVKPVQPVIPYETEVDGNVTYKRYTDGKNVINLRTKETADAKEFIFRTTVSGKITREEKAWDFWANRATATYVPINSCMGGFPQNGEPMFSTFA